MEAFLKRAMSVHPIYYALAPWSMLFRSMHCLPLIMMPATPTARTFEKHTERCRPTDVPFQADNYSSFQFVQYHFTRSTFLTTIRPKLEGWSHRNFGIDANIETSRGRAKDFVKALVRTRPSERIVRTTHLFVLFPQTNELICLFDHYYCDGLILFDFFVRVIDDVQSVKLPFPTYRYVPVLSDIMASEFTARVALDALQHPSHAMQYGPMRVLSRVINKREAPHWNRWANYAMNVLPVFECTDGLPWVRVCLNVGISTDSTFGNNRIGGIIVRIVRPPVHLTTFTSKTECLMRQFEEGATKHYTDGVVSYDILRSYDTSMLRTLATTNIVDIYFTSMYFPVKIKSFDDGLGAFIGNDCDYRFFYVNAMTDIDCNYTTVTTNWTQFNHSKYMSTFGARLRYTFD
jgi:hypothetical protein